MSGPGEGAKALSQPCPTPRPVWLYGEQKTTPCRRRSCPSCGVLWLGDTRVRALAAAQELRQAVALVTVTAPGVDVLPWDSSGRRVDADRAREWNQAAPAQWSKLHDAAARVARELARDLGVEWALLFKAWEYQRRGVLHLHLILPCGSSTVKRVSEAYTRELHARAASYSFGFVDRGKLPGKGTRQSARELSPVAPGRAAAYVAKYLASTGAGKGGVAEVARHQGVPGPVLYVNQRLTRASGVTMRSLRHRRRVMCRYPDQVKTPEGWQAACQLDAIERRGPRLTPGTRGALLARLLTERPGTVVDGDSGELIRPTAAARPHSLRGDAHPDTRLGRTAVVRLDSVLHHADESPSGWVWRRVLAPDVSNTRGTPR